MSTTRTYWTLPIMAAAMPWPTAFRMLSRAAQSARFAVPGEHQSWQAARRWGQATLPELAHAEVTETDWRRAFRLIQLVDRTDLYLYGLRGARWGLRHVRTRGKWPDRGAFLALTHHWGAGLWALVHMGAAGHHARALTRRFRAEEFGRDRMLLRYARLRNAAVERATGARMLPTGGAMQTIREVLNAGTPLIALCDVPGWATSRARERVTIQAPMGAATVTFPLSIIRLACRERIPIALFAGGVDRVSGERWVEIEPPETHTAPDAMAARLAQWLEYLIARDPVAWHMWPYAEGLLTRSSDAAHGEVAAPEARPRDEAVVADLDRDA